MAAIIEPPAAAPVAPRRLLRVRLGWFASLAIGSAAATAAVAYVLRWALLR